MAAMLAEIKSRMLLPIFEDIEEEELTRDKIKKASSQLTTAHDRRLKKQRRSGGKSGKRK